MWIRRTNLRRAVGVALVAVLVTVWGGAPLLAAGHAGLRAETVRDGAGVVVATLQAWLADWLPWPWPDAPRSLSAPGGAGLDPNGTPSADGQGGAGLDPDG